jgi:hypothetical protein
MFDIAARDVAVASAIVIILTVPFIDRQLLFAAIECIKAFW